MNKKLSIRINEFIAKNSHLSDKELSKQVTKRYASVTADGVYGRRKRLGLTAHSQQDVPLSPVEKIRLDREERKAKVKAKEIEQKYEILLSQSETLEAELDAMKAKSGDVFKIPSKIGSRDSEAVAVALWSDFHLEEQVRREWVNGLNEYNLDIAQRRVIECTQNTVRLLTKEQQDARIDTLVLWLGGDFITGNIHDENVETALMLPIEAMIFAETLLKSAIQHILDNTNVNLVIPCNAGNHTRITKKQRHSTDVGNSLETIMYHHLAEYYKGNKRVRFVLQQGYHIILPIYQNFKIRFHHGHAIKFGGGVGGLYIPARKAISQWQKSDAVQLDCFGHLHTQKMDGDLFICNGSLIGYSPYAVAIKCDFEKPKQTFFLVDKKRGKTGFFPITFSI